MGSILTGKAERQHPGGRSGQEVEPIRGVKPAHHEGQGKGSPKPVRDSGVAGGLDTVRILTAQSAADVVTWARLEARHQERNQGKGPCFLQCLFSAPYW